MSDHYTGAPIVPRFRKGEPWKKVFGPVFIYLNRVEKEGSPLILWNDAKSQVIHLILYRIIYQAQG